MPFINCQVCQSQVKVSPCELGRKKYCGIECRRIGERGRIPHNKIDIPLDEVAECYQQHRDAVRRLTQKYGVSPIVIYRALKELGISRRKPNEAGVGILVKERNGNYKGGFISGGYKAVYQDGKPSREHRVVAAQILGRELYRHEVVHHIDGNPLNNHPDNLMVMSQSDHMRLHWRQWAALLAVEGV